MTQSVMTKACRCASAAVGVLAAALLGGCGLSSVTSGLGSSILGGGTPSSAEPTVVSEQELIAAAKAGGDAGGDPSLAGGDAQPGCPKFLPLPRDRHLTIYEPGRVGDGLAIVHRGEITKTARECTQSGNQVTVKYGFAGRILLGPRGKSGPISMPITVFVTDTKREKVATDALRVDSTVAVENPIGYFSAVRTITFVVPEGARPGEFQVNVGFDRNTPNAG